MKTVFEKLTDAKDACLERWYRTNSDGARRLYNAVWHLWNYTPAGPLRQHTRECPAYGNYQPPYKECTCGFEREV